MEAQICTKKCRLPERETTKVNKYKWKFTFKINNSDVLWDLKYIEEKYLALITQQVEEDKEKVLYCLVNCTVTNLKYNIINQ